MRPEDLRYFTALSPDRIGGLCCFLEAGGEPPEAREAQSWVIRMRVEHPSFQGKDVETVCYHEAAFSCFLSVGNPEYPKAVAIAKGWDIHVDPSLHISPVGYKWSSGDAFALFQCHDIFLKVMRGEISRPFATDDVFMYYSPPSHPKWADVLKAADPHRIGNLIFHRGR